MVEWVSSQSTHYTITLGVLPFGARRDAQPSLRAGSLVLIPYLVFYHMRLFLYIHKA